MVFPFLIPIFAGIGSAVAAAGGIGAVAKGVGTAIGIASGAAGLAKGIKENLAMDDAKRQQEAQQKVLSDHTSIKSLIGKGAITAKGSYGNRNVSVTDALGNRMRAVV
jgi:hypothetical protein